MRLVNLSVQMSRSSPDFAPKIGRLCREVSANEVHEIRGRPTRCMVLQRILLSLPFRCRLNHGGLDLLRVHPSSSGSQPGGGAQGTANEERHCKGLSVK